MSWWTPVARILLLDGGRALIRHLTRGKPEVPALNQTDEEFIGGAEVPREQVMDSRDFYADVERQLIRDEGMRLKPYHCSAGALTIGVGRNLDANGITEREAMHLLRNDLLIAESEVSALACYRKLNDPRKAVLINMAFNLGITRLLAFRKMIAALNAGDYDLAAKEAMDSQWAKQVGVRALRLTEQLRNGIWVY